MAMPSGNVVLSDKMQFPPPPAPAAGGAAVGGGGGGGGGVVGGEIHQHHQPRQWMPDERDGFIYWLRGEFAAANAIIDSLCHHLREVGDVGEYESVIACIQQRRCNWNPVLHMQQYFSVAEVSYSLQQVAWKRRQRHYDQGKFGGFKRSGMGYKGHNRMEVNKEFHNSVADVDGNSNVSAVPGRNEKWSEKREEVKSGAEVKKVEDKDSAVTEDKKDAALKTNADSRLKKSGSLKDTTPDHAEPRNEDLSDGCTSNHKDNDLHSNQNQKQKQNLAANLKTFVGNEVFDGKMVNVVDGLKLYEDLFDKEEVSNLVSLVNDLRAAGKRGQFQGAGQIYVATKKPMKGHGREMIQLGLPIADAPLDDEDSKDRRMEAIPALLQEAIDRLVDLQVITAKPDSCIIDVYSEGDHSQPCMWPPWFGKPVCVMFLTECDITFGRVIGSDHPGDYKGSLKLTLAPGSLLVMQGKSADFAKHALPSVRKQRILVTFTKYCQPKKSMSDSQRVPSPSISQSSQWGLPPSRSPNQIRHPTGPKHYTAISTTGVLPAPTIRPQIPPPNGGVQTLYVPTPVAAAAIPFPAPVPIPPGSNGWPAAPPRHPPPRLPLPGTGVFLPPPGSGSSSSQHLSTTGAETNIPPEANFPSERENGTVKPNHPSTSPQDGKSPKQDCNGSVDGTGNGRTMMKEEQQSADSSLKKTC